MSPATNSALCSVLLSLRKAVLTTPPAVVDKLGQKGAITRICPEISQ